MQMFSSQQIRKCTWLVVLCGGWIAGNESAAQWPQFLGPDRNGISTETGLIDSVTDSISVTWRVTGGVGMSAVAVSDGIALTTWNADGKQWLVALDAKTGAQRWKTALGRQYENSMGDGPRATPAIAEGRVFAFTGEGILVAADLESGDSLWTVNTVRDNGARPSEYGMASSPLVVGDRVIVHAGGPQATVCAYDAKTGKLAWSTGSGKAGYSSPTLLSVAGEKQLVCFVAAGVLGVRPSDGDILWTYPFQTPYDCNTASPIAVDGNVFVSAGENHGSVLLNIQPDGSTFRVTPVWDSTEGKSVMRNEWQTSVVQDGYLYGFDNVGSAGPVTHLSCIHAKTGEPVWQEARFGKGNVTLADGKLWITTMKGELVLADASPDGYRERGRTQLFGTTRQSLSIADGFGYIRDDANVLCIKLKK